MIRFCGKLPMWWFQAIWAQHPTFNAGYARAGRIMDQLEEKGIVGPANGSRPREVLVDQMELETLKAFEANDED